MSTIKSQVNNTDESELLISELVSIHNIQENPDFEEQVREVMEKYIVFLKHRLPRREQINNEFEKPDKI